ncbi:MAG TPA: hypothetical protein VFQ77_10595 [Pseudonocardiaceae bacterium]|nr:hypothetical protein [Pseudonocardiaceae bacterium]
MRPVFFDWLRSGGGQITLRQTDQVEITALRAVAKPEYARPAHRRENGTPGTSGAGRERGGT